MVPPESGKKIKFCYLDNEKIKFFQYKLIAVEFQKQR